MLVTTEPDGVNRQIKEEQEDDEEVSEEDTVLVDGLGIFSCVWSEGLGRNSGAIGCTPVVMIGFWLLASSPGLLSDGMEQSPG